MSDYGDEIRGTIQDISEEAKSTYNEVREEAQEVVQEARAAVTGQKLDSSDTVGAAGYREAPSTGNGAAIASLVLGILSLICAFFGYSAIAGLIFGIIGVILGAKARKAAQTGLATGGFVCSLIGLIFCAIGLVCVIACVGTLGALGAAGALS